MTKTRNIPGFKTTMAATTAWLGLLVLIPLSSIVFTSWPLPTSEFWKIVWNPRAVAAYELTFGGALIAAVVNGGLGLLIAWVLARYDFFGKNFVNSLIDIPFALPTAVAGLTYSSLYGQEGWLGRFLHPLGIQAVQSRLGVCLVLTFVSLPFVVRSLQPVFEDLGTESEEAAHSLGATRWQAFRLVIFPSVFPALLTGVALAFARAVGEYGSLVFVAGTKDTEFAPLLIMYQLEQTNFAGAAAIALVLLIASFVINGGINLLSRWSRRHEK
ncbi:MAG TPA: sulfate ABC transporter permease subunit CysT [Planctomycetota bacterium]|jgi:sulfate transport system permease protein|nr:sulfate ABC transporter permease subunit CysT [Planctomycetota bacterium]